MKRTLAAAIVVASLTTLTACDSGTPTATTTPTTAPAAAPPPPPPPPAAPAAAGMPGLSEPYATEADFVAGCTSLGKIDKSVCECVGKATTKELGQKGLFQWVWEGYVQNAGMGRVRGKKWLGDNTIDEKKFAAAIGKCYVTQ